VVDPEVMIPRASAARARRSPEGRLVGQHEGETVLIGSATEALQPRYVTNKVQASQVGGTMRLQNEVLDRAAGLARPASGEVLEFDRRAALGPKALEIQILGPVRSSLRHLKPGAHIRRQLPEDFGEAVLKVGFGVEDRPVPTQLRHDVVQ